MEGMRVERKGWEKVVVCRRVDRTAIFGVKIGQSKIDRGGMHIREKEKW